MHPGVSKSGKCKNEGKLNLDTQQLPAIAARNSLPVAEALEPFFCRPPPIWKRAMDIIGALFGLVVLSPLLLLVALLIKIVCVGPVLFKQKRVKSLGKEFTMLKFRTMNINRDPSDHKRHVVELIRSTTANNRNSRKPMTKLDNDPQIILFGKILRKICLDELPQLINVLLGEMSLVGPRPPIQYEVEEYPVWCKARFDVTPGMTGLWQVSGKNRLTFDEMVRLDIWYSRRKSVWLDTKILLQTPLAIISNIKDSIQNKQPRKGGGQNG